MVLRECKECAMNARISLFLSLLVVFFVFSALFSSQMVAGGPSAPISLDKQSYVAEDTVDISINIPREDYILYYLQISSLGDKFTYRGEFNPEMFFYPTEEGIYTVALAEQSTGAIYYSVSFNVSPNENSRLIPKSVLPSDLGGAKAGSDKNTSKGDGNASSASASLSPTDNAIDIPSAQKYFTIEKYFFKKGEIVRVTFSSLVLQNAGGFKLYQSFNGEKRRFMGELVNMEFVPSQAGNYELMLTDVNEDVLETAEFVVLSTSSNIYSVESGEPSQPAVPAADVSEGGEADEADLLLSPAEPVIMHFRGDRSLDSEVELVVVDSGVEKSASEAFPDGLNGLKSKKSYDLKFKIPRMVNEIEFKGVALGSGSSPNIGLEEVSSKKISIRNKRVLKSFAVDASTINFTSGNLKFTALGTELWKCKEWIFEIQICAGEWKKVMDITPGRDYNIEITPDDPAYAQTGVATVNSIKPIYLPGEEAEIVMVVLDTSGHLVGGADITLEIKTPLNQSFVLGSSTGGILESERGIYRAFFGETMAEGTYELLVHAVAIKVDSSLSSSFDVMDNYAFDILRNSPVTTDPFIGPFESSITLKPRVPVDSYEFTEVLPYEFSVVSAPGAKISSNGSSTLLSWDNLSGDSEVSYVAQPPLITPALFALGRAFVDYRYGLSLLRFFEARLWYLAIDPLFSLFFEDFESGWGCRTTGTPTAGDDCSLTPWGYFTGCAVTSTARFCTTDDGQEGSHTTYALQMTYFGTSINYSGELWTTIDPSIYDDINVNGYVYGYSLDNTNEFCSVWARDSDSYSVLKSCTNNVCEGNDATPDQADYTNAGSYFDVNLISYPGINLSENSISIHIGQQASGTADYCFFDRINITGIAYPPNITNLTYPANRSNVTVTTVNFNFTVNDSKDTVLPSCTLWANFSGTWAANTTIYNVTKNTVTNITLSPLDGGYIWNIICMDSANLTDWYDYNFSVTIDARPPVKTVKNVDADTVAPWNTSNRNPYINISLNKNGNCRMSPQNESYADMADNYDCTGDGTPIINCTYSGAALTIGANIFFIACNDTRGHADTTSTNAKVDIDILCDSHADCLSAEYCDYNQDCHSDEPTGYNCISLAYDSLGINEVCGDGSDKYCVNDTSYSYTGWYCTADTDDCVYNDGGNSYTIGYDLCIGGTNDYKQCSASNLWGGTVDCSEQYDPNDQSATAHSDEFCGYFASAQSCIDGVSSGCSGSAADCGSYIYNQTTQICGSVAVDCDMGCGANCDPSNSTVAVLTGGVCYYNKNCDNDCAWSEISEEGPDFCINDNDGGPCAYNDRTSPVSQETCYWSPSCVDVIGASLNEGLINNLRIDYCDFCNESGNHSRDYSPIPNASCSSGCADEGTIYYDSGLTPGDRSDDCIVGASKILADGLNIGDVWNSSGLAYCDNPECNSDCGLLLLNGSCNAGVCECTDVAAPELIIISPGDGNWTNNPYVQFLFYANDTGSGIQNCSLITNGSIAAINETINESIYEQVFIVTFENETVNWSIVCYDNSLQYNANQSGWRILGIDTVNPLLSDPAINGSGFEVNQKACLNITASDEFSGILEVLAQLERPGQSDFNFTLSDSETTSCDDSNGDGVFSVEILLQFSGVYNWSSAYAIDRAGNMNMTEVGLWWDVSAGGVMNVSLDFPTGNIRINESESNNYYLQNCTMTCTDDGFNCTDVVVFAQYGSGVSYYNMNTSSLDLVADKDYHSCDNVSINESCSAGFNITAGNDSGNNNWSVRCMATSKNGATVFSSEINVSINDHPIIDVSYPPDSSWVGGTININASLSYDNDGSIANYLFDYDNASDFSSPTTICSGPESNCTWDTTMQGQCQNNIISCYLRVVVWDNDGLSNESIIVVGFDTAGPGITIDMPYDFENISYNEFWMEASVSDNETGNISFVFFEYRENNTESWKPACNDSSEPYTCLWNLTLLRDENTYEVRAYAVDSSNNTGNIDTRTNITVDRAPPIISLESPPNDNFTSSSNVLFYYNVSDAVSAVTSCILVINESISQFNDSIVENQSISFNTTLSIDGRYVWSINCTDERGNQNSSEMRNITLDTTGPSALLDRPADNWNITDTNHFTVNASASDEGIGTVSRVIFGYMKESIGSWTEICISDTEPYSCIWDLGSLDDGDDYQVRAWANDSLGNIGSYDIHVNVTLDNYAPNITDVSPQNNTVDGDGNLLFSFRVADLGSEVVNCSLIWNGSVNQTNSSIVEGVMTRFYLSNIIDGDYNWSINCTDSFSHISTIGRMNISVFVQTIMTINITLDKSIYYSGSEISENITINTTSLEAQGGPLSDVNITNDIIKMYNKSEPVAGWWNTSWLRRKPIFITASSASDLTNITVVVNVTGLDGNITNCTSEMRVASIYNYDVPVNILSGDDSTYCEIAFKANVTANANKETKYYAYYNNSAAPNPGYDGIVNFTYLFLFENFDGAGWARIANVNPGGECAGGYGSFTNCMALSTSSDYAATSTGTHISGGYTLVMDQWSDWNASRGIYYNFNGMTACGGGSCDDVLVTGYAATGSVDSSAEFCRVWARNTTGEAYTTIYECVGPSGPCEFNNNSAAPTSADQYNFFNQTVTSDLGMSISSNMSVHIGGNLPGTADECYYEDISITGIRKQALNISAMSTGSPQEWIARSMNNTDTSGFWQYIFPPSGLASGNYSSVSFGSKSGYNPAYNYTFFEMLRDSLGPNITLTSPENDSRLNTNSTYFNYIVYDALSAVRNCTLILDYAPNESDDSIQENITQYLGPLGPVYLGEGWHNWSINCTDEYNNTASSELRTLYIDSTLPLTTLDQPLNDTMILAPFIGYSFTVNASVEDNSSIIFVRFMYRVNSTDSWKQICDDTDGAPYQCVWSMIGLSNGDDYEVLAYANDSVGNIGLNSTHGNITVRMKVINITSVVLEDEIYIPSDEINLVAGSEKLVYCNVTLKSGDDYPSINGVNATLHSTSVSVEDADNNRTHYTNSSCRFLTGGGDDAEYICSFSIKYYAINGTWNCTAKAWDNYTNTAISDNSTMNQLFAINISTAVINYTSLEPNQASPEVAVNMTNIGNMPMNISVYGYGGEDEGTGSSLSMVCEINNVSVHFEKYSTGSSAYLAKSNLSSTPKDVGLTIPPQDDTSGIMYNTTYWQFMVPVSSYSLGQCNGSVVFMASSP